MPTYETQWFDVTDGDSTTHNPEDLVGSDITIDSAEIQWEGKESTGTVYSTNTNSDSATASESTTAHRDTNSDTATAGTDDTKTKSNSSGASDTSASTSMPTFGPSYSDIESNSVTFFISNTALSGNDVSGSVSFSTPWSSGSESFTLGPGEGKSFTETDPLNANYEGESVSISDDSGSSDITVEITNAESTAVDPYEDVTATASFPDLPFSADEFLRHEVRKYRDGSLVSSDTFFSTRYGETESITTNAEGQSVEVQCETVGQSTSYNSETASTTYPSVPSGYTFDRHRHIETKNGSEQIDEFIFTNKVGDTESISTDASQGSTASVELKTRGSTTETQDTQDPSVSGDVSGSYTGTLDNDVTSPWQTLTGLAPGDNTFDHSIGGSNQARFRFRFDYTVNRPTALKELRFYDADDNQVRSVALADPNDGGLDYDSVRVAIGGTVYAVEVVQRSDAEALPECFTLYHPTDGELSPREL